MSAETLRRAAAAMRERAEAATPGPWSHEGLAGVDYDDVVLAPHATRSDCGVTVAETDMSDENAEHIASWHPAVALAVAEWLDAESIFEGTATEDSHALAVARTFLGEEA